MAVTLADLVAEVEDFLSSHGADRDKECTLTGGGLSPTALTFTVDDATLVDRGMVEIDYELIGVASKVNATNTVTVPAWGRGLRATTAAVHSTNSRVAVNPRFPRSRIRTEINLALANLFPDLFGVGTDETNTLLPAQTSYPLPAEAEGVLKVAAKDIGPSKMWAPMSGVRFDYTADPTTFPTGRSVDISDRRLVGQTLQVVYMKKLTELTLDSDTLASTGADDSWRDIVVLGACAKMMMGLDPRQLQTGSMEQQAHATAIPPGSATAISRQLLAFQATRIQQERSLLFQRYPSRVLHSN